jgi:hypothetical protein
MPAKEDGPGLLVAAAGGTDQDAIATVGGGTAARGEPVPGLCVIAGAHVLELDRPNLPAPADDPDREVGGGARIEVVGDPHAARGTEKRLLRRHRKLPQSDRV